MFRGKFFARPGLFILCLYLSVNVLNFTGPTSSAYAADSQTSSLSPVDLAFRAPSANLPNGPLHQQFGIAAHPWWLDMFLDQFINYYKDLRITVVRLPFEWKMIEPEPGKFNWSREDRILNRLNDEGFEVVAEFVTVPVWASKNKTDCALVDLNCDPDPAYRDEMKNAARASVQRYPFIRYWEFWNEPEFWPHFGQRDISDYAPWLKAFYETVKKVDPTLLVSATTLNGPDFIDWLTSYCDMVYGMRPWDAVSYHPYNHEENREPDGRIMSFNKPRLERLRAIMLKNGDGNKPIWITEIGWQVEPEEQAADLVEAFNYFSVRPYITMVAVHMLHDWDGEKYGLLKVSEDIYWKRKLNPNDTFVPKQPYYDTYKFYDKRPLPPKPAGTDTRLVFQETRLTVQDVFAKAFKRGGIELFGFPKTGQFYERNPSDGRYYLVQYFERVRMEYHPEYAGTQDEVLFGLLGNQLLTEKGWIDQYGLPSSGPTLPETKPAALPANTMWFRETGHTLSGPFLDAWKKQGGLSIVGFPKTNVFDEYNPDDGGFYKVQYFERARMELHPAKDGKPALVLFGLLGNDRLRLQGRLLINNQPNLDNYYNPALPQFTLG